MSDELKALLQSMGFRFESGRWVRFFEGERYIVESEIREVQEFSPRLHEVKLVLNEAEVQAVAETLKWMREEGKNA